MGETDRVRAAMRAAARVWGAKAGHDLLGRAQRDAPLDEGTLRGSGTVEIVETPAGVDVTVAFATPYAARQHEEVSWQHPKGGKAKYLEDALKEQASRYEAALAAAVARVL